MTERPDRPDRQLHRRLRRADALLREAERALHDLPDHHCPIDLLARVRLHNAANDHDDHDDHDDHPEHTTP